MPGEWNAKESYIWLKTNCPGMEGHILFTFSNGVEPADGRAFIRVWSALSPGAEADGGDLNVRAAEADGAHGGGL